MKPLLILFALTFPAFSQFFPKQVRFVTTNPSGACGASYITQNTVTGLLRGCFGGTWGDISTAGGVSTTAGATFGAFTYDFTASTVSLPALFMRTDTSSTDSAGVKRTLGLSSTTAGLRLTAGTLPSSQSAGDIFMNAAGVLGKADGTNADALVSFLGSGTAFGTAPTATHNVQWAAGYKLVTTGSTVWAVANGGTGTASTLTGLVRGNASAMTAAELSGDVSTSGSNATTIGAAKVAPSMMKASTFDTQTDGATVTWAIASVLNAQGTVTLGGNRTLAITNPVVGGNYLLKVVQDGTGSRGLVLGSGCTWKVSGGSGAGAITPTTTAAAIDVLAFTYDGTNCYATFNKNFN